MLPTSQTAEAMIRSESGLAGLAMALIDQTANLSPMEQLLALDAAKPTARAIAVTKGLIRVGDDPLGDAFCQLRSARERRSSGATYTPKQIVDAMIGWANEQPNRPVRVVDPGAGSGRYLTAAAKFFPDAQLVAVELDPLPALLLRANATVLGFAHRLTVLVEDFRAVKLPPVEGPTLFIGNPPYVRHHEIPAKWKTWFAKGAALQGFKASKLAGLHIHFFLKTHELARPGDFGAFITAAEWMDVNYGSVLREMLADGLGGAALHVIDPNARPFADAMTTGAITCFQVGNRPPQLTIGTAESLDKLAPLSAGRAVDWSEIETAPRWSILVRDTPPPRYGEVELGELFRVHRGQVTGCNEVWIAGSEAKTIPSRYLFPSITKARDLFSAGSNLDSSAVLKHVVDLPVDLDDLTAMERESVDGFLRWAREMNADKSFIARHRRAWWAVGLRPPAPILCTYMARRTPAFVRNRAEARHLNIAHGLYPVQPLSQVILDRIAQHLNDTACISAGRTYAGGLVKFEPGEVARLHIPEPSSFGAAAS